MAPRAIGVELHGGCRLKEQRQYEKTAQHWLISSSRRSAHNHVRFSRGT
jgi:hypothetical protein